MPSGGVEEDRGEQPADEGGRGRPPADPQAARWPPPERGRRRLAAPKGSPEPPAALRRRHEVTRREVGGFPCTTVAPRGRRAGRAAVYLHGGAYVSAIAPQHWALVSRLADAGVRVEVPHYGLAPQHTYREAYPFATAVYRDLLDEVDACGRHPGRGLGRRRPGPRPGADPGAGRGCPSPGGSCCSRPWLDLTLSHPDLPAVERRDPWLSSAGLHVAAAAWAGGDDPTDPRLSPGGGPLAGLAPVHVYVGTREICLPDALSLRDRARAEGADVELTVCEGAVHVYPLVPAPEGRAAAGAIVREIAG